MSGPQTEAILAKLFAAFPRPPIERVTIEVYAEQIGPLDFEQCLEAITLLIRSETFRPAVAEILDVYRSLRDKYAPPALREPPMSEEQRLENLRQSRLLVERLARANEMPTKGEG